MPSTDSRNENLDLIRAIATIMVVLIHSNSGQFSTFTDGWWISNVINSSLRMDVPIFVILSGTLIITRVDPLLKHCLRVGRLILLLLAWSYIYAIWIWISGIGFAYQWDRAILTPWDLGVAAWAAHYPMMSHLPFLYELAIIYLFAPILQAAYVGGSRTVILYYVVICFIAACISTVNATTNVSWLWLPNIQIFATYAGYAMFGALTAHYTPSRVVALGYAGLAAICIACTAVATALISADSGKPNELLAAYGSPSVILASGFTFLALKGVPSSNNEKFARLIATLSRMSLGVYFVHMVTITGAFYVAWQTPLDPRVGQVLFIFFLTTASSLLAVWLIQANSLTSWLAPK